jgi:hypothetical protein
VVIGLLAVLFAATGGLAGVFAAGVVLISGAVMIPVVGWVGRRL